MHMIAGGWKVAHCLISKIHLGFIPRFGVDKTLGTNAEKVLTLDTVL